MFRLNSAINVARYVIDYSNKKGYGISNLKLQKILYFIQAYFLIKYDKCCFKDKIDAWDIGPVIPNVYNQYKHFGGNNILIKTTNTGLLEGFKDIQTVVDVFKDFSATDLTKLTQSQLPWKVAYKEAENITENSIKSYFKS